MGWKYISLLLSFFLFTLAVLLLPPLRLSVAATTKK